MVRSQEEGKILMSDGSTNNTPIYYKEQTVGNDDKLYDVMILIKPKNAPMSIDNASQDSTHSNVNQSDLLASKVLEVPRHPEFSTSTNPDAKNQPASGVNSTTGASGASSSMVYRSNQRI